jgi:hypothetical protein
MRVSKFWLYAFVVLLLNSAYLWPFAEPTLFYLGNLILHMLLGLVLAGAALVYLFRHFKSLSFLMRLGLILFLLSTVPAMVLMKVGGMRPNRWLLHTHIAMAIPAAILLAGAFRAFARKMSFGLDAGASQLAWRGYLVALPMLVVLPAGVKTYQHYFPSPADRIQNPTTAPTTMFEEGAGENSPFFPSSANTTSGKLIPSNFFMTSETCKRCHADIYEQWNSSMHRFSSFNNQWYRKSIEYMQDVVGTKPSKWCAG